MIRGRDIVYLSSIDWGFHWHGPQEVALRLASAGNRVLYVENTGVRAPRLSDTRRVVQRLAAWARARLRTQGPATKDLHLLSPLLLPPFGSARQRALNRMLLARQVKTALKRLDMNPTLIWTYLASDAVEDLIHELDGPAMGVVYYCVMDLGLFASDPVRLAASEEAILARSDAVFTSCAQLAERLSRSNGNVHQFPFGVDLAAFAASARIQTPTGADLARLPHPLVGYVGGLHAAFDLELVVAAVRARPAWSWVFVGQPSRPLGELASLPNVHLLGQRPHADLPEYIRRFDVCIVPYARGRLTDTVVPTKINEYLAAGKPVVATDIPNVVAFDRRHRVLEVTPPEAGAFIAGIERVLAGDDPAKARRRQDVAAEADWGTRLERMSEIVERAMEERRRPPAASPTSPSPS